MRYVKQELRKSCGVACVAMVAGISFAEAGRAIGKVGCTTTSDLRRALNWLGFPTSSGLVRIADVNSAFPDGIVKVRHPWSRHTWHWVVKRQHRVYDPQSGVEWLKRYDRRVHMSSVLIVKDGWS